MVIQICKCLPHNVGTRTVIRSINLLDAGTDFIAVSWNEPRHIPYYFQTFTDCHLISNFQTYKTVYLNIPRYTYRLNITNLKPGSLCVFTFLAVFNPAKFDRGVKYVFQTLEASKSQRTCYTVHACLHSTYAVSSLNCARYLDCF